MTGKKDAGILTSWPEIIPGMSIIAFTPIQFISYELSP